MLLPKFNLVKWSERAGIKSNKNADVSFNIQIGL